MGVEQQGGVPQIEQVEPQAAEHFLHGVRIAVVDGGVRGHARSQLVQQPIARIALHDLVDVKLTLGPGADERHIPDQHVPQLGKLVEVMPPQEPADPGQPFVRLPFVKHGAILLRVQPHAAELINIERAPAQTDALLPEKGRSAVLPLDGDVGD